MFLMNDAGTLLNATIEVKAPGIVLHSRSGKSRNRDYRQALELIMTRLDTAGIGYNVYLDSARSQHIPLAQRLLEIDMKTSVARRFDLIVRAMNDGTPSHGAWKRLLIVTSETDQIRLAKIVDRKSATRTVSRLPSAEMRKVQQKHIHQAVEFLRSGGDAQNFAPSRDYDALTENGEAFAPKKVFGLALEYALGIEAYPANFSASWGQPCFELLEDAGLWIVPKRNAAAARPKAREMVDVDVSRFVPTEEETVWIEGNPRIVSHLIKERQPGLAHQKRKEFLSEHGRLFCEDCGFDPVSFYGGAAGAACIEVHHHRTHLAKMQPGHLSSTDDLKCLCANCHRVLHRKLAMGTT
ncbi:hypothetical protein GAO09_29035 [Rhizobiales bacterium RZME27]|uniref:HNH endonuclease n=1 Tax=Endobacterium cereale TaxID=2663029 RepID=A0A6A8AK23_9HYPH|nr:hypothetical protein [Endobacterium cereale]MQY50080.1 hypothetical protein [Endobacterium cereale]